MELSAIVSTACKQRQIHILLVGASIITALLPLLIRFHAKSSLYILRFMNNTLPFYALDS